MEPSFFMLGAQNSFTHADFAIVAVIFLLFVITGVLALAETSLVRMSRAKALSLQERGKRGAKALLKLVENPTSFLHPILFSVFLAQTISATLVGILLSHLFNGWMIALITAGEVLVVFLLAEAIPKNWAVTHPERAALLSAPFVTFLVNFAPLALIAKGVDRLSAVVIPGAKDSQSEITESELLAMADVALEEEIIETSERAFIHSILAFGDTVVKDVMKPRTEMVAVDKFDKVSDVLDLAMSAGYSRMPVFDGSVDNVVGIVVAKDLVRMEREGQGQREVNEYSRDAHYVPETKKVAPLLKEMQEKSFHLAIVIDEYGGTAGVVTMEDLIEELVGEIIDEYDTEDPQIVKMENGKVKITARLTIEEANEHLTAKLPSGDWDTIGGLLLDRLGRIPKPGDSIEIDEHKLEVAEMSGRRIVSVLYYPSSIKTSQSGESENE